ncbi:hypothetical protein ACSFA0_23165 [Variovorax sp. LT1P1]|uniref:hypothetical protein n=1 Tax=Variovorax sp. LT1P1 TaxID=3443730 RepID=UPI003F44A259
MAQDFGIITSCTARKRAIGHVARLDPSELTGGAKRIARRWLKATRHAPQALPAGELYVGRAMTESKAVAVRLRGSLHVVSAGLGLAAAGDQVPNYDLTVSRGGGSLGDSLAEFGHSASDWWEALNELKGTPMPLSRLINRTPNTRYLLAMPSTYVGMLTEEFDQLNEAALDRVFVFTSRIGALELGARLRPCVMPYDERLEGHPHYAGTRAEFPQRAMRHFVEELGAHRWQSARAAKAISESLARLEQPVLPERQSKTDAEISALIRTHWDACEGKSSNLLHHLRNVALVRCEQSRFASLWHQVKAQTK